MASQYPMRRVTIMAPPDVDPTETTPLSPATGAPHSDPFRVCDRPIPGDDAGVWKSYLQPSSGGRHARIDPIQCKTDVGSITVDVGDATLDDDDAATWLAAFVGDDQAREQVVGNWAQLEISLDGGFSWLPEFAGRVGDIASQGRKAWTIPIKDEADRLDVDLFDPPPDTADVAYATQAQLLPLGIITQLPVETPFGEIGWRLNTVRQKMRAASSTSFPFQFRLRDRTDEVKQRWVVSRALADLASADFKAVVVRFFQYQRNVLYLELADASDVIQGRFWVRQIQAEGFHDVWTVTSLIVEPLEADDPHYLEFPAVDTDLYGALYPAHVSADAPLVIGSPTSVNVVTLVADILDGKFGRKNADGTFIDKVRRNSASFTALASTITSTFTGLIGEKQKAADWLAKAILKPNQLVLVPDATGALDIVSLARPTGVLTGLQAITDDMLVATTDAEQWNVVDKDRVNLVEIRTYELTEAKLPDLIEDAKGTLDPPPLLEYEIEHPPVLVSALGDARAATAKPALVELDLHGYFPHAAVALGTATAGDLIARYGRGGRYVTYRLRRGVDELLKVGDRRALQTSDTPDLSTHQRGVDRVGMCIEVQPNDLDIDATLLDEGLNVEAAVPTLGTLSLADGTLVPTIVDPAHIAILDTPDANANGDPVEVQIAITDAADSSPAAGSSLWQPYTVLQHADGLIMLLIMNQPQGKRLWVRGRSVPPSGDGAQLPSAWVTPTPASIVMGGLTAPTGLAITNIGPNSADAEWTIGDPDLQVRVYVNAVLVQTLPAGSVRYRLIGLAESTLYDVDVVEVDAQGGETDPTSASFTTLGSGTTLPRPAGLQVLDPSAIDLRLFWADPALPGTLERAPDDGTGLAPDTGSTVTIADDVPGGTVIYHDPQPIGPAIWWYRFAQGSGGVVGPWTAWVKGVAKSGTVVTPPYIGIAVAAVTSEAGGIGTLGLTIADPQIHVTSVEFRTREGVGAWSSWTADTSLPYGTTVSVTDGQTSQIEARVLGYDALGTAGQTLWSQGFTFGAALTPADATYITDADERGTLANSLRDVAGTGITITKDLVAGTRTWDVGPIAITDVSVVASEAAQLALTVEEGDVAIRSDEGKSYIHNGGTTGTMADWTELVAAGGVGGGGSSTLDRIATYRFVLPHLEAGNWLPWPVDFAADAVQVEMQNADGSTCTATVEIDVSPSVGFPAFADITGGHDVVMTAAERLVDDTLTDWTPGLIAGDTLRARISSTDAVSGDLIVTVTTGSTVDVVGTAPRPVPIGGVFRVAGERQRFPVDSLGTLVKTQIQGVAGMFAVVSVWLATSAGFDTFTRIGTVELSGETPSRVVDTTLSGFTALAVAAGDTLELRLDSLSTPAEVNAWLTYQLT